MAAVVTGKTTEYSVGRPQGRCHVTGQALEPDQPYVAALRETAEAFERVEFSMEAWADWPVEEKARLLAFWRTRMPSREATEKGRRKLLVDDEILGELFRRLADVGTDVGADVGADVGVDAGVDVADAADADGKQEKLAFRFMLGLILMRRKKLVYEGHATDAAGREVWRMRFRKQEQIHDLIDPKLDESRLEAVGRQVGQILSGGIDESALSGDGDGEGA